MLNLDGDPVWRPVTDGLRRELPGELIPWVIDTDSLTQRLRALCGRDFRVALREQRWQRPLPAERAALGLRDRAYALVRQVHLLCGSRQLVFARTVMPSATLQGARRRFAHLGNRPLGAMLFSDRGILRGELEVAHIEPGHRLHSAATRGVRGEAGIWGRRSVFLVEGYPLLVSEIFLPAIARAGKGSMRARPS